MADVQNKCKRNIKLLNQRYKQNKCKKNIKILNHTDMQNTYIENYLSSVSL